MKLTQKAKYPSIVAAIIAGILFIEGGYVDHPNDPGGETNYGITKQTAVSHGYTGDMRNLPKSVAESIYASSYIESPNFNLILDVSEPVAAKVIDTGVNVGVRRVARWYQRSLNSFSRGCRDYNCITVDGLIGPATITAHQKLSQKRGKVLSCKLLIRSLDVQQGNHYLNLHSLQDFTVGWFTNRIGNVSEELCDET